MARLLELKTSVATGGKKRKSMQSILQNRHIKDINIEEYFHIYPFIIVLRTATKRTQTYVRSCRKKKIFFSISKTVVFFDFLLDSFIFGKTQNETELAQKWFKLSLYIWIDGISN